MYLCSYPPPSLPPTSLLPTSPSPPLSLPTHFLTYLPTYMPTSLPPNLYIPHPSLPTYIHTSLPTTHPPPTLQTSTYLTTSLPITFIPYLPIHTPPPPSLHCEFHEMCRRFCLVLASWLQSTVTKVCLQISQYAFISYYKL